MRMSGTEDDRVIEFEGSHDLVQFVRSNRFESPYSHEKMSKNFCGYSFDETIQALESGWKESESIKINADAITMQSSHKSA